jgi:predicted ATP-dependent endonuclease of OLD family
MAKPMIKELRFINYRCFLDHALPLKQETIIVGKNNAGKSTIIEGFRIIGLITKRYKHLSFHDVPDWLDIPRYNKGVRIDLAALILSWENLFHRYQDPPACVTAIFTNNASVEVYLGPNGAMHAVLKGPDSNVAQNKRESRDIELPIVSVLPQVMPLSKEENIMRPDYVSANMSSYLSSSHFRNQLNLLYDEYFDSFKMLVEDSWHSLQLIELQGEGFLHGNRLGLLVRDSDFVAEIAWMGHGLQMWLQTMWFLTRAGDQSVVILDEPDVYMHPDLQRKLLRFMRGRFPQQIIATHSTEILSEADANNVLIIDRKHHRSAFATDLAAIQRVAENIGSAQNLTLTRLWNARKLLLVEGKDLKLLKQFQNILFPESEKPFDVIPNMSIGGWSGWPYALGSAMLLKNSGGEEIKTYCILDSDYHTDEEKANRLADANSKSVELQIWSRKEIEYYLVIPSTITRLINDKLDKSLEPINIKEIMKVIDDITMTLKDATTDAIANEILLLDRASGLRNANVKARQKIEKAWQTREGRISIVSGKDLLSMLSQWCKENYNVSFGIMAIATQLHANEIPDEINKVITAIENGNKIIF